MTQTYIATCSLFTTVITTSRRVESSSTNFLFSFGCPVTTLNHCLLPCLPLFKAPWHQNHGVTYSLPDSHSPPPIPWGPRGEKRGGTHRGKLWMWRGLRFKPTPRKQGSGVCSVYKAWVRAPLTSLAYCKDIHQHVPSIPIPRNI